MRLAVSQLAWQQKDEPQALDILREYGFTGLEIVPTRIAGSSPYEDVQGAADYAAGLRRAYGLSICSMQSIWYGQKGTLFGPEREFLLAYTKKAIRFAEAAVCGNLVFGCPGGRVMPEGLQEDSAAVSFFKELGDFAENHGAVLSVEPNPPLYNTNYINTTPQALDLAKRVNSPGFAVNLDFGTLVENGETIQSLEGHVSQFNHVHISEPNLVMIQQRESHRELAALLRRENYGGFVSIEMKDQPLENLRQAAQYVAEVFA